MIHISRLGAYRKWMGSPLHVLCSTVLSHLIALVWFFVPSHKVWSEQSLGGRRTGRSGFVGVLVVLGARQLLCGVVYSK